MNKHPDDQVLMRWHDGMADDEAPDLIDHLADCPACQERLSALVDEGRALRTALRLTPAEMLFLRAADLPGRVVAAVAEDQARIRRGLWHLAALFGVALAIGLAWSFLEPVARPALEWSGRLVDLTGLALVAGIRALVAALTTLFQEPVLATIALADLAMPAVALALLLGLWFYRLGPAPARSTVH